MRTQWCREHIDKTAEECCLGPDVVRDVKRAASFCDEHPDLSDCSTRAIMALIRIKDKEIRDQAISLVKSFLHRETTSGIKVNKSITEKQVREIINIAKKAAGGEPLKNKKETLAPTTNEVILFPALVCFECKEVRNHNCTVNKVCPVCGNPLKKVTLRIFEGF